MNAPLPANLDREIACAWNDDSPRLTDLLTERARREEAAESIDERCFRLGLKAADKDAEAGRHWFAEADAAGRAAFRRLSGNDDAYAASFDREAAFCREEALKASAEADRLRSQVASLRRAQSFADQVVSSLNAAE